MTKSSNQWAEIGTRLRWHRVEIAQLGQALYAKKAGLNPSQYSNWETGYAHVTMNGALKLLRTYDLSIDFIVDGNLSALSASLFRAWMDRPSDSNAQ